MAIPGVVNKIGTAVHAVAQQHVFGLEADGRALRAAADYLSSNSVDESLVKPYADRGITITRA
jgi:hypothetical protein